MGNTSRKFIAYNQKRHLENFSGVLYKNQSHNSSEFCLQRRKKEGMSPKVFAKQGSVQVS